MARFHLLFTGGFLKARLKKSLNCPVVWRVLAQGKHAAASDFLSHRTKRKLLQNSSVSVARGSSVLIEAQGRVDSLTQLPCSIWDARTLY